ncbi:MAG: hypothetical protein CL677_05110 [Bdellovibrionaceae bacterium]|nr:hypothetical protein [Pseudobdellovibrionaceae bacterium]|tara:strand:+ start:93523 stop:95514 length:1992 start_codon:yes stop_codon:yes gene_type:complete
MNKSSSILIVGHSNRVESSIFEQLSGSKLIVTTMDDFLDELKSQNPDIIFFCGPISDIEDEELVKIAHTQQRGRITICYRPQWEDGAIIHFKNNYGTNVFLDDESLDDFGPIVEKGLQLARYYHEREGLFKKLKSQNLELEALTVNLENVVEERTKNTLDQKQEVEEGVNKIRGVIRFVKELSSQVALEETLLLIRNDLKRFHKINQCILAVSDYNLNNSLYYYRRGSVVDHQAQMRWSDIQMIRINSLDDQKYLADELGMPIGQVISVSLGGAEPAKDTPMPVLYFEHSMTFDEIDEFVDYISFRLQAISITVDRILLQNEVRNVSYMWERTFDSIDNPVAIINRDFQVLRANQEFFSRSKSKYCFESIAEADEVCQNCPVEKAVRTNVHQGDTVLFQNKSYEVHSYPIIDRASQAVSAVVNHYIDMTEANELQGLLVQNEKMSAIGHLAGHIAHELNNPLTGIRSLAQLVLEEEPLSETMRSDLTEVEKASARCQNIIKNLLEFSSDKETSEEQVASLSEIVEKTLPFLKTAMGDFRRDIRLLEDGDEIRCEPQLLQQVIFNLINNACQAMQGSGELSIVESIEDDVVKLSVKDSGSGIDSANLERIFEPFYTTKEKGQGTGLGLSMCKRIVESYHGKIYVKSELNVGSEFVIEFPKVNKV